MGTRFNGFLVAGVGFNRCVPSDAAWQSKEGVMPFWRLYYHLVWATKSREALIRPEMEGRLYAYLVHKAAELDVYVCAVNGCADHVHVVAAIPPKHAVADVVKHLKGASSRDLNAGYGEYGQFAWQRGYGALFFGERQLPEAKAYVANQKEHHRQQSTNVWLERDAEFDEGPPDRGRLLSPVPGTIHDQGAPYDTKAGAPF